MMFLSKRALLSIAAVVDIAIHARPAPVAAKSLAGRLGLPPRHLEPLLQAFVRAGVLKGVRGPRGGYELAKERRKITVAEVVKVAVASDDLATGPVGDSRLVKEIVIPIVADASLELIKRLGETTIADLCSSAETRGVFITSENQVDFTI